MSQGGRRWGAMRNYEYEKNAVLRNGRTPPTEDEWKALVLEQTDPDLLKAAVVALQWHDQDWEDDGSAPKGLHVHMVVIFNETTKPSLAYNKLRVSREENFFCIANTKSKLIEKFRYLCHLNADDMAKSKHIYDPSTVVMRYGYGVDSAGKSYQDYCHGRVKSEDVSLKESIQAAHLMVQEKLMSGEWTVLDAKDYYCSDPDMLGFDATVWRKQKRSVLDAHSDWLDAERNYYIDEQNPRCLTTTYIYGDGRSGKDNVADVIAKHCADHHGIHKAAAKGEGKTFDFADKYEGQKVSIFPEVSGSSLGVDEFNGAFDPKRANTVNSRNSDKEWFAREAILTNSLSIEQFVYDMYIPYAKNRIPVGRNEYMRLDTDRDWQKHYESKPEVADKIRQIRGRFAVYIEIIEGQANFYYRNNAVNEPTCGFVNISSETYIKVGSCSTKDEQAIVELYDKCVHLYYEQDTDYFIVTPWNTPTRAEAFKQEIQG